MIKIEKIKQRGRCVKIALLLFCTPTKIVPLTAKVAVWLVDPTILLAIQVYSPAWCAATESILSSEIFLLVFIIEISG